MRPKKEDVENNQSPTDRWGGLTPISTRIFLIILFILILVQCVVPTIYNDFTFSALESISANQIDSIVIGDFTILDEPTIEGFLSTTRDWEPFFFNRTRYDEKFLVTITTNNEKTRHLVLYVRHDFKDVIVQHQFSFYGGAGNNSKASNLLYDWMYSKGLGRLNEEQ